MLYSLPNALASASNGDFSDGDDYAQAMELKARIFKARTDARLTQEQLATAIGKTRGAVAQWESGEVRPRHSTLTAVAAATGKTLHWLESGLDSDTTGLMVVGEVAAGLWKEGGAAYRPHGVPVAPDPRYPAAAQRLYQVTGNSVNKYVASGEYVHCVELIAGGLNPEHGDLVIVRRAQHGRCEYTAKAFFWRDGAKVLAPVSTDAEWQSDITLEGDDSTDIEITDIIIAKWSPIGRR